MRSFSGKTSTTKLRRSRVRAPPSSFLMEFFITFILSFIFGASTLVIGVKNLIHSILILILSLLNKGIKLCSDRIQNIVHSILIIFFSSSTCFLEAKISFKNCSEKNVCALAAECKAPELTADASISQTISWFEVAAGAICIFGTVFFVVSAAISNPLAAATVVGGAGKAVQVVQQIELTPEQAQLLAKLWNGSSILAQKKTCFAIKQYCDALPPDAKNIRIGEIFNFIEGMFPELTFYQIMLTLMRVF